MKASAGQEREREPACEGGHPAKATPRYLKIARLAAYPLLVLDTSFVSRRTFDATCRLAGIEANIVFESRTPHTLLAMAERGHGLAIVPSAMRIDRYPLRIVRVTYRGKPLRERLAVFWDKRRPLPSYATAFCAMLAASYACGTFAGPASNLSEERKSVR